jgi:mRNA interferase RelE/StbE
VRYRIVFTKRAERDLESIPVRDQARLARRIDTLAANPRPAGAKKLTGADDLYRLRSGDYRVVYSIEDDVITVTVIRMGHRRDIYR